MTRCSHELMTAITAALIVLGYHELPESDIPDESIWHHAERLEEWFEAVKQRRDGFEPVPDADPAEMTSNELAKEILGGGDSGKH